MLTALVAICVVLLSLKTCLKVKDIWNRKEFVWLTGDQWAIITGASSGIGFEFARQLALKGYNLMLISRNEENLNEARKNIIAEVNGKGELNLQIEVRTLAVDFTRTDIYEKIEQFIDVPNHDVYILVNNVGVCPPYPQFFTDEATADHLAMLHVNVLGATRMMELVLPTMAAQNRGLVINVSSIAARYLFSLSSVYAATKAYIGQLSECLALEYRNFGITFCTFYPSAVSTKMIHNAQQDFMTVSPERYVRSALTSIRHKQSVHQTGYWAHSLLELFVDGITLLSSRETVGTIIERCSLGYQALVRQMEQRKTDGIERFHMWNVLTHSDRL